MLKKLPFFLLILLGVACTSTQKSIDSKPKSQKPLVLTAILELQAGNHGSETMVKLLNIVKAPGHAKISPDNPANFEFRFVDSRSHTVESVFKQINLTKVLESVDDDGHLIRKKMDGEPVVIPVRTNYRSNMKKLLVLQMVGENYEAIASFELNKKK